MTVNAERQGKKQRMREASRKDSNAICTFADKEEADYSKKEKAFSKTEFLKKPWEIKKRLLPNMELRLDDAIDKLVNLSKDVEINRMYKNDIEKVEAEIIESSSFPMVATNTEFQ